MIKTNLKFGAAYYPEHWETERLETDIENMLEMGFTTVRMGEFAWNRFFPFESSPIHTGWIDNVIERLGKSGIKTIIGTPTATPPKYIFDKYRTGVVDERGISYGFGSRRHYCVNNDAYINIVKKVVKELALHFRNYENVIGFQIDNEFGGDKSSRCYCGFCRKAFKVYLKNKFKTIEYLNEELGTSAWNQTYCSFEEIDLPAYTQTVKNPHMELEYKRFQSDSVIKFKSIQRDILTDINPAWEICTNIFEPGVDTDNARLVKGDSYVGIDNYPNMSFDGVRYTSHGMIMDMCRGYMHKPFLSMETQSGIPGANILFPTPRPGAMLRNTIQSMGHGAEGVLYFRYRTNTFGAEQNWHGILGHDGKRGRLFDEVVQTRNIIDKTYDILTETTQSKIAIVHSKELHWVFEIQPLMLDYNYYEHILEYYNALFELGLNVDMISQYDSLDEYSIVIAPNYIFSDAEFARKLESYVASGKTLIMDYRCGVKDKFNKAVMGRLPNDFSALLGIEISEYGIVLEKDEIEVEMHNSVTKARAWYDYISLVTAEKVAEFRNDYIEGLAAITLNNFKNGFAYYIGTNPNPELMRLLFTEICNKMNLKINPLPAGVELITKSNGCILINHSDKDQFIDCFVGEKNVVDDVVFNGRLNKGGVAVFSIQ